MKNKQNLLKQNFKLILSLLAVVVLFLVFGIFFGGNQLQLEETDLDENGISKYHKLVINEIMSSNGGTYSAANGNVCDWVEIYNGGDHEINLLNYGLSDRDNATKWIFPDTVIAPKGYLMLNLCGEKQEGLYPTFKLASGGGETIALKNASGKIIDAVETVSLKKNQSMIRNLEGAWVLSMTSTPGFPNTKEGYQQYLDSIKGTETSLKITEVLPRNKGNYSMFGKQEGFIELTNTGKTDIDLSEYQISESLSHPFTWNFPKKIIKPGEIIIVYTSGKNRTEDYLESNFKLDSKNGVAVLSQYGKVIQIVTYENLPNGYAKVLQNDSWITINIISPGYPNTVEGVNKFSTDNLKNPEGLIISEAMNQNSVYLPQNGNQFYDWVEIKNNGKEPIRLSDYHLSTDDENLSMWKLPDITLNSGEYYVVMASGNEKLSNQTYLHTNFKLSEIESLYLSKENKIADSMFLANIPLGSSFGRGNTNGFFYFGEPTPKASNKEGIREISIAPTFSEKGGVYDNNSGIDLALQANGTIYYTVDGSKPTHSSKQYNGSIFIDKTTVMKAISVEIGKKDSEVVTSSYIVNEKHTLPIISVSLNQNDFNHINSNTWELSYDVPAYVEYYQDDNSFSLPCAIKLFGGSTRGMNKKSYALKFRARYGAEELVYPMFDERDNATYKNLVLRSGSQDYENAFIRDILGTSLASPLEVETQAYRSTILYVNGVYYGIYNIREKVDEHFISEHYNVDGSNSDLLRIDGEAKAGDSQEYQKLLRYVESHNLANTESYNYVKERVSLESLIDFWTAQLYVTNNDIVNCRFFSHPNIDQGKWHYIFYDLDFAFYNYSYNYYNFMLDPAGMATNQSDENGVRFENVLLRNLMKNEEFKTLFVERLAKNLKEVWNKERVLKKIDELYQTLLPEMPRNQKRWGLTMETWNQKIKELTNYVEKREGYLVSQTKSFFHLTNDEMKKYFGDMYA